MKAEKHVEGEGDTGDRELSEERGTLGSLGEEVWDCEVLMDTSLVRRVQLQIKEAFLWSEEVE